MASAWLLSSRDVVNPTFTAPRELTADVVLSFRLLVTDPSGRFDSDTVTITVEQGTSPPQTEDQIYYFPHLAVGAIIGKPRSPISTTPGRR